MAVVNKPRPQALVNLYPRGSWKLVISDMLEMVINAVLRE